MNRVKTGIHGLDQILLGGIPEYATVLIAGSPGIGKTILAQNILFNVARSNNTKVLYISTVAEPQIKVLRYQCEFEFFDTEAFMDLVIFHDLGSIIRTQGLRKSLDNLDEVLMEHSPAVIVIDSLKAVHDFLAQGQDFQEFIYDLNIRLSLWESTVLLLGEYNENQVHYTLEATMVDGIMYLYGTEERKYQKRYLRILKMRGTDYYPGENIMSISDAGVSLYPRIGTNINRSGKIPVGRHSTGIQGLDEMLNGGLPIGSTTLVTGGTGTGKSILGLNWIKQGIREGEPGLIISFDESVGQLIRGGSDFGWNLQSDIDSGLLTIEHVSPIELDVDLHFYRVQEVAAAKGVKRIVIDSISSFEVGMQDKVKYTDYLWGQADYFKAWGISLMLIHESSSLFEVQLSKHGISYIADNIIFFQYHKNDFELVRLVGVLKMRWSKHHSRMRQYSVGAQGPLVKSIDCGIKEAAAASEMKP